MAVDESNSVRVKNGNFSRDDWAPRRLTSFTAVNFKFKTCLFRDVFFERVCFGGGCSESTYEDCSSRVHAIAPGFSETRAVGS